MPTGPSLRDGCQSRRAHRCGWFKVALRVLVVALLCAASGQAVADPQPAIWSGVPQQVIPTYAEVGLGSFSMPTGTNSLQGGSTGSGSGTGTSPGTGTSSGSGSSALNTMLAQSWGAAASANATALGITPASLATTCVMESGCQNVSGSGTIAGAFQMSASTYTSMLNAAIQQDPNLAQNIVPGFAGQMDPATESIAASEYMLQGAQTLQNDGVVNPTALDVRGYYNFGPAAGAAIAQADPGIPIADLVNLTPAQLQANGITSGETVGQWRAGVTAKLGTAASVPVLSS